MKKKKTIRRSQKDHIRPDNIGSLWPSEGILEYTGKSLKFAENSEFILILSVYWLSVLTFHPSKFPLYHKDWKAKNYISQVLLYLGICV